MAPLKKACSEARPRADFRTRGRLRELFSVESFMNHGIIDVDYLKAFAEELAKVTEGGNIVPTPTTP